MIIKFWGHYVMAYVAVSVNIPSIIGQTPGSIDFSVAYWGWQGSHAPWKTLNILEKKVLPGEP
jgi:hypothetical protein